ncbi:MAG: glycosyltransferase family 4 protein [Pseudomonadota bacterium]
MTPTAPRVAFYAPMKAPDHPTPSGDREIARLTMKALGLAGFTVELASDLRIWDKEGDCDVQTGLIAEAAKQTDQLLESLGDAPPDLWFTYHCYYKAPDLIGPQISRALGIPYVISEPSISPRRTDGPWAAFAIASDDAISAADRLFWITNRDRPALEDAGHGGKMVHLPAFLDPGPEPDRGDARDPLRLLTIAMMRAGDKVESYRRMAAALVHMPRDWHLTIIGDGPARDQVERMFAPHAARVNFVGAVDDAFQMREAYDAADLFLWPGVGEGVGMVFLEAQAAGVPVIAEDHPAQRDLVVTPLATPDRPMELADLIVQIAEDQKAHGARARSHIERRHSLQAAAARLGDVLRPLIR